MVNVLNVVLLVLATLLLVPVLTLFVECVAALLPTRRWKFHTSRTRQTQQDPNSGQPTRMAILMPAHDEALGIAPVLESLLPQVMQDDRLIVVADNCSDNTAEIARQCGATVIERTDPERRGKGYALDYGIQYLAQDPPDILVLVDADCEMPPFSIDRLVALVEKTQRPVQAIYLMEQPAQPSAKDAVSSLAFLVKNLVRPLGLANLGMPCLLTGTGMAFPWSVIQSISLASGNLVEDMQLGIDLAIAGHPPQLCSTVTVYGRLPQQTQAAKSQRTRWEHGHLQTQLTQIPRLFTAALRQTRLDLLAMALDLAVPPLSLLVLLWLGLATLAILAIPMGIWLPASFLGIQGLLIGIAILTAWAMFGRTLLPAKLLVTIPLYILWKVPLYIGFLLRRQTKWVRTSRDPADSQQR